MTLLGLHIEQPLWWLALAPLLLAGWWLLQRRSQSAWQRIIDAELWQQMVGEQPQKNRPWFLFGLWALICLVLTTALAGPAWQRVADPMARQQPTLVLALDLSRNMLAEDVSPNRLDRARFKLYDLLASEREARVALIAFAGEAFTVAPLTHDADTVSNLLSALAPDIMPVRGQRSDRGLSAVGRMLDNAGLGRGQVVVISHRADARAISQAASLQRAGHRVHVLAVGTEAGAPVPADDGGFVTDADGSMHVSRLDLNSLQRLAAAGGGEVIRMSHDERDLQRLRSLLRTASADSAERADDGLRWQNQGPMLLLLALPVLALVFRRGVLLVLVLLVSPLWITAPAHASNLWQRADQRAWQALQQAPDSQLLEQLEQSLEPDLAGALAYRQGDFERAEQYFSQVDTAAGHYNRGNALAMQGRRDPAIEAYEQALALDPEFEDAAYNLDLLKQQPPEQDEQSADDQDPGDDSDTGEETTGDQDSQAGEDESEQPGESDSAEADSDEQDATPQDAEPEPGDQQDDQVSAPESLPQEDAAQDQAADPSEATAQEAEPEPGDAAEEDSPATDQAEPGEAGDQQDSQAQLMEDDFADYDPEREALERQLLRLPDDPGRLLRNKFRRDYELRRRHGLPVEEPD